MERKEIMEKLFEMFKFESTFCKELYGLRVESALISEDKKKELANEFESNSDKKESMFLNLLKEQFWASNAF